VNEWTEGKRTSMIYILLLELVYLE